MNFLSRLSHRISRQRAPVLIFFIVIILAILQPLLANAKPITRGLSQLAEIAQSTSLPQEGPQEQEMVQEDDNDDEEASLTATATRTPTQTPAAGQSNVTRPAAAATSGAPVDDSANLIPFAWDGDDTIAAQELTEVAPPLQAEVLQGDFQISFVEAGSGAATQNSLRILPVLDAGQFGAIRLGVTLDEESFGADFPAGATLRLQLTARVYAPEGTARLALGDDEGSSSVLLEGLNWQDYQVTRAIDAETGTVEFFLEWSNVPANGWLEMRGLSLAAVSGTQAATRSPTDTPTRLAAATASPTALPPTATPTPAVVALATATPVPDTASGAVSEGDAEIVFVELTPTATFIVVTSTPTPVDVLEEATRMVQATEWARILGSATPTPPNLATPTPTFTPFVIVLVKTPTPENAATAIHVSVLATAVAFTTGTPTPYPPEATVEIATDVPPPPTPEPAPTATPTPLYVLIESIPTAAPVPTLAVPAALHNKIVFLSFFLNQPWAPNAMVINPDGSEPALLTTNTFYYTAKEAEAYSPDRRFHVFAKLEWGGAAYNAGKYQLFYDDRLYESYGHQLTYFGAGVAWGGVFSPDSETVALVSSENGNDEIWIVKRQTWPAIQLTHNEWEWDHHPSFSPDGGEIVFSSNRISGNRQLWMMTSSGGEQRQLTNFTFEAWDPVWIKYVEGQAEPAAAESAAEAESDITEGETESRPGK